MTFTAFGVTRAHSLLSIIPVLLLLAGCQQPEPPENSKPSGAVDSKSSEGMMTAVRRHAQPVTVNYPETGVDVGWGWDSEEGIPQPNICIEYSIEEDKGQTKYMTMTEVSDTREVMQSMNVSAAASVKTIAYQASGSAEFSRNTKINSASSNFVLNVSVDNGVRYATPLPTGARGEIIDPQTRKSQPDAGAIRLTPEALRLAKQRDLTRFLNLCGDAYVAALYGGARLTAVITVTNSSKEEKQSASSQFSGSGWGVNVKASASGSASAKIASSRVSMRFYQSGGRDDAIPASKEELVDRLGDITRLASDYPAYYRITLMPYTALSNWPDKEIELDLSELDQLAGTWAQYATVYEDLERILEKPSDYKTLDGSNSYVQFSDTQSLKTLQDRVQATLNQLRDEAIRCSEPEQPCEFNESRYLSPYAHRIQMPLPSNMLGATPSGAADLVDFYIRSPVKSRCRNNPVSSDCLSNAQIDRWESRVGKTAVELPDRETAEKLRAKIAADREKHQWLDVIDAPPYAWVDAAKIEKDQTALSTVLALLETEAKPKTE